VQHSLIPLQNFATYSLAFVLQGNKLQSFASIARESKLWNQKEHIPQLQGNLFPCNALEYFGNKQYFGIVLQVVISRAFFFLM
jgi:hypothetical protein